jgi:hypothetical protein
VLEGWKGVQLNENTGKVTQQHSMIIGGTISQQKTYSVNLHNCLAALKKRFFMQFFAIE